LPFYLTNNSSQLRAQLARTGPRPLHLPGMRIAARLHQQAAADMLITLLDDQPLLARYLHQRVMPEPSIGARC